MKMIDNYFDSAEKAKAEFEKGDFEKAKFFAWQQIDLYLKKEFREQIISELFELPRSIVGIDIVIKIEYRQNGYQKAHAIYEKFKNDFPELEIYRM